MGGGGQVGNGIPTQYRVSFPAILALLRFPVEGCRGTSSSKTNLRLNFAYRHPQNIIVILEEGNKPHPRCFQCEMFVPQEAINQAHPTSAMCRSCRERNRSRLMVKESSYQMGQVFSEYGTPQTTIS